MTLLKWFDKWLLVCVCVCVGSHIVSSLVAKIALAWNAFRKAARLHWHIIDGFSDSLRRSSASKWCWMLALCLYTFSEPGLIEAERDSLFHPKCVQSLKLSTSSLYLASRRNYDRSAAKWTAWNSIRRSHQGVLCAIVQSKDELLLYDFIS